MINQEETRMAKINFRPCVVVLALVRCVPTVHSIDVSDDEMRKRREEITTTTITATSKQASFVPFCIPVISLYRVYHDNAISVCV